MADKLIYHGFDVLANPNGIHFNPYSIGHLLSALMDKRPYTQADLVQSGELWHSWEHHHLIGAQQADDLLHEINETHSKVAAFAQTASVLVLTFGTAYVYRLRGNGRIVANCHKVPAQTFAKERLSVQEIVDQWTGVLDAWKEQYPETKVILTVSPVRHLKDGFIENQRSKSVLLLATEELCSRCSNASYFPSYELMMDDLRDYRWYADDMLHPSAMAINYIWEAFYQSLTSEETQKEMLKIAKLRRNLSHRPMHMDTEAFKTFRIKAESNWKSITDKYPHLKSE